MENKARKMFAAVVVIMLCAVAIVGVGYAYTATTTNSGNAAKSEYVVLSQNVYSFGTSTLYSSTENDGTVKYILDSGIGGTHAAATEIGGTTKVGTKINTTGVALYGAQIGTANSTLKATFTGEGSGPATYTIVCSDTGFTNLSGGSDWSYVLLLWSGDTPSADYQYAIFNGTSGNWSYYIYTTADGGKWSDAVTTGFVLSQDGDHNYSKVYNTALLFAGVGDNFSTTGAVPDTTSGQITFTYTKNA